MLNYLGIFILNVFIDAVWTKYIAAVADRKAHAAASWSVLIVLLGAVNVMGYMSDHWLLVPAMLGGYLGAYMAVKYHGET